MKLPSAAFLRDRVRASARTVLCSAAGVFVVGALSLHLVFVSALLDRRLWMFALLTGLVVAVLMTAKDVLKASFVEPDTWTIASSAIGLLFVGAFAVLLLWSVTVPSAAGSGWSRWVVSGSIAMVGVNCARRLAVTLGKRAPRDEGTWAR